MGIFFCLRLRFCVFRFAFAQSPFAVCMRECVCVCAAPAQPSPHALAEISRFSASQKKIYVHPPKKKQFGGGFHWQLEVEEKPFSHFPQFPFFIFMFAKNVATFLNGAVINLLYANQLRISAIKRRRPCPENVADLLLHPCPCTHSVFNL